jgi:glycosyltransferase involved in cell wall biosynthesis|tara:strand:- start:859 stop:1557 length:699 start_codon:yes stop_codon:yes gene_type:complete
MISKPKVTILLSVYNGAKHLSDSIDSLLFQTYKNIEILIIDDNSNDATFDICKKYEESFNNIKVFKNLKNLGLTKNLNFLIEHSSGTYLARQDADDISEVTRIEKQIKFMNKYKLDACTTRAYVMKQNKVTPNKSVYMPKKLVMRFKNPFIHGSLMIKKTSILEVGKYNEKFYYSQDYKLMYDLIEKGYKVKIIKKPLYILNMEGNISIEKKDEQKYYAECVRRNTEPKNIK